MMSKNTIATTALLAIITASSLYWMLKPTYKHTVFYLDECSKLPVTMIEYTTIRDRGVAFVYGQFHGDSIPTHETLVSPGLTGFDAIFDAVITCNKDSIYVNSHVSYFDKLYIPNSKIIAKN